MKHTFNPSPASIRVVCAIAALLCTTLVLGWIDGLADHYGAAAVLASARPVVVAQH